MLAAKAGVSPLGVAIDCGAFVSMFACVLACATAAARVLLRMAHDGLAARRACSAPASVTERREQPSALRRAHVRCDRGHGACAAMTGSTMYDLLGSLAVFGFLTAYALVALALPFARRALGQHSHCSRPSASSPSSSSSLIAIFDLNSAADAVHARIPYLYLGYIAAGWPGTALRRRKAANRVTLLWKTASLFAACTTKFFT